MANKNDPSLDPSTTSSAYDEMKPKWDRINALLGGTAAMREAGQTYLPQHPHESSANYQSRLEVTTLTNYTEQTLESLVGKPFSDPVKLSDDMDKRIKDLMSDIDLQGNNLHQFTRQAFREGVGKGLSFILVDMPAQGAPANGFVRTLADDLKEGVRPYWVLICPEDVIFASTEMVNGKKVLTHVRIMQEVVGRVGFAETVKTQIKVLEPGLWQIWEEVKDQKKRKPVWRMVNSGTTGLSFIPLVPFYTNKTGDMKCKPPLEDLAFLNVRHWQSTSDQMNILTVARFPMLAVSGAYDTPSENVLAIGPRQLLATRAENGKFYYVEHTGAAIGSGEKDLEVIEQYMATYGAEFLRKRPGSQTATARALDSAEATSPLQDMTLRFNDAVNLAIKYTGEWLDIEENKVGTVQYTTDFGPEEINDVDVRGLLEARRNRDLSNKNFLLELQRRGVLRDDFDYDENLDELQTEPTIESPFATGRNVDGSGAANVNNSLKKAQAGKAPDSGGNS